MSWNGKRSPHYEVLCFSGSRVKEIDREIDRLKNEKAIHEKIIAQFEPLVCQTCYGEGYVMRPVKGCECDGPRMHVCHTCSGGEKP